MACAMTPESRTERRRLYKEACKNIYELMHRVNALSLKQRRRDAAFKPSMAAQASTQKGRKAQGLSPVV